MPRGGRVRSRLTGSEEGKRSRWGEALRRAEGLLVCPLGATRNVSADLLACSTRRLTRAGGGESEERGRTVVGRRHAGRTFIYRKRPLLEALHRLLDAGKLVAVVSHRDAQIYHGQEPASRERHMHAEYLLDHRHICAAALQTRTRETFALPSQTDTPRRARSASAPGDVGTPRPALKDPLIQPATPPCCGAACKRSGSMRCGRRRACCRVEHECQSPLATKRERGRQRAAAHRSFTVW